ncbi:MAG TPA: hypothetical protein VKA10_05220 [Prolixibacteraceae bacterium]|nr:hypothetical protein [Prolixibacteraceae bacterium]
MNRDKKELEILLINYFRESFTDFPKGKIVPSESPDFLITFKNRHQLGIELTRLNPGNATLPDEQLLQKHKWREDFIERIRGLVEKDIPHRLFVKFLFSEVNPFPPENELVAAAKIAQSIRRCVSPKNPHNFFTLHLSKSELLSGLDEILIVNHPKMQSSIWERSNNLGVSGNVIEDIRVSILKKDEKLRLYQKQRLNYYWLLIVTDRLRGEKSFNLQNQVQNHTFQSRFQHVYLFDLIKSNIFELV